MILSKKFIFLFVLLSYFITSFIFADDNCVDLNYNCHGWVASDKTLCTTIDHIAKNCKKSCGICKHIPKEYDISKIPPNLQPLSFLVGIWRSEHGGKAFFPTIPRFTYGEEIQISISDPHINSYKALNYTAFAWSVNNQEELHSETGYITMANQSSLVSLTTVMNNGFITVEEGHLSNRQIRFRLVDIGRISFSRDLPVHDVVREWTLIDSQTLQSRLDMETLTHRMQEHTSIIYTKIFP